MTYKLTPEQIAHFEAVRDAFVASCANLDDKEAQFRALANKFHSPYGISHQAAQTIQDAAWAVEEADRKKAEAYANFKNLNHVRAE